MEEEEGAGQRLSCLSSIYSFPLVTTWKHGPAHGLAVPVHRVCSTLQECHSPGKGHRRLEELAENTSSLFLGVMLPRHCSLYNPNQRIGPWSFVSSGILPVRCHQSNGSRAQTSCHWGLSTGNHAPHLSDRRQMFYLCSKALFQRKLFSECVMHPHLCFFSLSCS